MKMKKKFKGKRTLLIQLVCLFGYLGVLIASIPGCIFGILLALVITRIVPHNWIPEVLESGYSIAIKNKVLAAITKLSYVIMKADEGISESELYTFRDYMLQNFGAEVTAEAIEIMRHLQYQKISSKEAASILHTKLNYTEKMQIMQFLFQLAAADGEMHAKELDVLGQIADEMQILQTDFIYLKNAYNYMYNRRYSSSQNQYSSTPRRSGSLSEAYAVLGMKNTDSNADIKAAYRRLAIANHPDKVQHLGETAHSEAEKRFSLINEAYHKIKKERGI